MSVTDNTSNCSDSSPYSVVLTEDAPPLNSNWKAEMMDRRRRQKGLAELAKLKSRIEDSTLLILGLEQEMEVLFMGLEPLTTDSRNAHCATGPIAAGVSQHDAFVSDDVLPMPPSWRSSEETAIVDAGSSGLYFMVGAPVTNINKDAP